MSETKKVHLRLNPEAMLLAVVESFKQVLEHGGKIPAMVQLGQVNGIAFELGAYDVDRLEVTDDMEAIDIVLDDPAIYEQLELKFLH